MKNLLSIFCSLLFFLLPFWGNGQTYLGIKFGGHLASLDFGDEEGLVTTSKAGISFSLYGDIPLSGNFYLQPELAYISKGTKIESEFDPASFPTTITLNYTDLYILGKFFFGSEDFRAFFAVGPGFGYTLNGKIKNNDTGQTEKLTFDENDGFNRVEASINLGVGAAIPIGVGDLTVDMRYLFGLSNLNEDSFDENDKVNNKGFGINFGIRFPIGDL